MQDHPLPDYYNRAEEKGTAPLCCRTIECFRPLQFAAVGYPFIINSIAELWKYTECMHDGFGLNEPMDNYLISTLLRGGFTKLELDEVKTIKSALDEVARFINHPVEYPANSMFLALNQARHISAVAPPGSTIVELGGGAGYLGALLVLRGYKYVATDVAQVFYLLQSHLISRVSPHGCIDLLDERYGVKELQALQPGQAAMVPWWRWAQRHIPSALSIDLATSNHNLLEMHPFSRLYHLSVIQENFSANPIGLVFQGWGDPSRNPTWTAVKDLSDRGFVLAHNDHRITCFTPKGSQPASAVLQYPLPQPQNGATQGVPPPPANSPAMQATPVKLPILMNVAKPLLRRVFGRLIDDFRRGISVRLDDISARLEKLSARVDTISTAPGVNPAEFQFAAPTFCDQRNSISRAVMAMREGEHDEVTLHLEDYRALMGSSDLTTQDERFLAYIFRDTPNARPWVTTLPN